MSDVYKSIMAGLSEALDDVQSTEKKLKRRRNKYSFRHCKSYFKYDGNG